MLNLRGLNTQACANTLTVPMRKAVAAAIAEKTLHFFAVRWPEEAKLLAAAISYCWSAANDESPGSPCADEWMQRVSEKVPNADIEPCAGPAIPAGETVLAALATVIDPTPRNVEEVVLMGYTTYEMDAYIQAPESAAEGGRKLGAEVQSLLKTVGMSGAMQSYLSFVRQLLKEARTRTLSELRSWTQGFVIQQNGGGQVPNRSAEETP